MGKSCTCRGNGGAGISQCDRAPRTRRCNSLRNRRRCSDRSGSGKAVRRASFYCGSLRLAPFVSDRINPASAAVFSSCVHGEPTVLPRLEMCCRTRAVALPNVALARPSSSRSRNPTTGMRQCSHASRTTLRKNSPSAVCTRACDARIFEREGKARPEASSIAQPTTR